MQKLTSEQNSTSQKQLLITQAQAQAYRLGKNPEKDNDPCPPVIIIFTTIDMVETVLNAARGKGLGKNFKEHIPEVYAKVYSD